MSRPRRALAGFTLLEVLIAVSILGLALTVILSSQLGLFTSSQRSGNISMATQLLRCRMNASELDVMKNGFPLTRQEESGPCCTDADDPLYACSWVLDTVELPSPLDVASMDGGAGDSTSGLGALGGLAQLQQSGGAALEGGQGLAGLSGLLGSAASMGTAGMAPLVMGLVYPDLKPMLEASIRKLTVTVAWREGQVPRQLVITQYLTNPLQGGLAPNAAAGLDQLEGAR